MAPLQVFHHFPRLPTELRVEIWRSAALSTRPRIQQLYYDPKTFSWQVYPALQNPLASVCKEARELFKLVFDTPLLLQHDTILIPDPTFAIRATQQDFLDAANTYQLPHIALTQNVWRVLRHAHYDFPAVSRSPARVLREMKHLQIFTLAVTAEDKIQFEPDSYVNGGPWTEERADEWLEFWDRGEEPTGHSIAMAHLEANETCAPAAANGKLHVGTVADRFLGGLEAIHLADLQENGFQKMKGSVRLRSVENHPAFFEDDSQVYYQLSRIIALERKLHPEWAPPNISVRYLEMGQMSLDDKFEAGHGYLHINDRETNGKEESDDEYSDDPTELLGDDFQDDMNDEA